MASDSVLGVLEDRPQGSWQCAFQNLDHWAAEDRDCGLATSHFRRRISTEQLPGEPEAEATPAAALAADEPEPLVVADVRELLGYYLGDKNLATDRFLRDRIHDAAGAGACGANHWADVCHVCKQ